MDQTKFIENGQYGKHIGKILGFKNMQKRPQAPKPIFGHLKFQKVQKVVFFENVRNAAMYTIVFYFFQNLPYVTFGGRVTFAGFS